MNWSWPRGRDVGLRGILYLAAGPYIQRMMATGRYPNLSRVIVEAEHSEPDADFLIGLNFVPGGIVAGIPD